MKSQTIFVYLVKEVPTKIEILQLDGKTYVELNSIVEAISEAEGVAEGKHESFDPKYSLGFQLSAFLEHQREHGVA